MFVGLSSDVWHSGRPYAATVTAGDWVFVSGQVPVRPDGALAGLDAAEQVNQVLENVRLNLEAVGSRSTDVVSTTVYLTDIADIDTVDGAYRDFFDIEALPGRTTVEISRLGRPEFRVEISAVAHRPRAE